MWILPELSKWTESTSSLLAPWHAPASLKVAYLWEAKAKVIQSGHKREKAQFPFSYSLCKHTFDQVHPTFYVQRIDKSLSLIKNHRSLGITFVVIVQSCLTFCDPIDYSMPGSPVLHYLPQFTQSRVHWVGDAIQLSRPRSSPSPPALGLPQCQGIFQWVSSPHQVAKILELQLHHQSFQWIFRIDFLWDWLVWSLCSPRDSKEFSLALQFESIFSSALSLLYGPTRKCHIFIFKQWHWDLNTFPHFICDNTHLD